MEKIKTTQLTTMLKTLTVTIALTIAAQAQAQHTQGPTLEGIALPNLSGGEEGEITEEQVIEVQRQCNENLVKEYLYTGSGGEISLVGKMEFNKEIAHLENTENMTKMDLVGSVSQGANVRLGQFASGDLNFMSISYRKNLLEGKNSWISASQAPSFRMTVDRKWELNGLGETVNIKNVVTKLAIVKIENESINFLAKMPDKSEITIFSYPTAKYVSCLKAGVASLAK